MLFFQCEITDRNIRLTAAFLIPFYILCFHSRNSLPCFISSRKLLHKTEVEIHQQYLHKGRYPFIIYLFIYFFLFLFFLNYTHQNRQANAPFTSYSFILYLSPISKQLTNPTKITIPLEFHDAVCRNHHQDPKLYVSHQIT